MTSNSSTAYPAEYYYPDFLDSRPDDPLKSSPSHLPLTTSIDNGIGSSTIIPTSIEHINETTIKKKPINKKPPSTRLALDVVTDQGLPDADITQAVKTDPKKNLLRDPTERNIPRLIVDDSVIKQAVRTPKIVTTNLHDDYEQTSKFNQINNEKKPIINSHINGDLTKKTKSHETTRKQQTVRFVEDEQPIDDHWKKEVLIDDEGVVTIEPVKYDKNTYEGPFGLTRKGSFIFYIGTGIVTILAAIFLIMTGIFYGRSYPDSSSNTGKLAGIGICAFAFYLGLLLIFIGLWHQKHRQENPTKTIKKQSNKPHESSSHLKSSVEEYDPYNYPYQQQIDYAPYGNYPNPPYASNMNEQMFLQQPDAGYYEPVAWPSSVETEPQPDPRFYQSMEIPYGQQTTNEIPAVPVSTVPIATDNNKPEKKSRRHHNKKTVEADPPKAKFDNLFPNSTATETPLPVLNKAPETNALMKTIADQEKSIHQTSTSGSLTKKNSNRIKPVEGGTEVSSLSDHRHHHHHRRRRHRRRSSTSSCSTCSSRSYYDFHSEVSYNPRFQDQHTESISKIIIPRLSSTRTPSPTKKNRSIYRDNGLETKRKRDSSTTVDVEDVPNVRDDRLEQIPVVRRTIIVEPYPAQPSSQIVVKPRTDVIGKHRLGKNPKFDENNETIIYPSTSVMNKNSKKKKKIIEDNTNVIEDLQLEDVDDDNTKNEKSKKKKSTKTSSTTTVENAFYN